MRCNPTDRVAEAWRGDPLEDAARTIRQVQESWSEVWPAAQVPTFVSLTARVQIPMDVPAGFRPPTASLHHMAPWWTAQCDVCGEKCTVQGGFPYSWLGEHDWQACYERSNEQEVPTDGILCWDGFGPDGRPVHAACEHGIDHLDADQICRVCHASWRLQPAPTPGCLSGHHDTGTLRRRPEGHKPSAVTALSSHTEAMRV